MQLYDLFLNHPEVTTDSRAVRPGGLFFALKGASFDGNRFAADALEKGAAYAVVDDPIVVESHPSLADRMVLVEDTLKALQELAREHRRRLALPIVAIVGSNGKTTTKELTARVLGERFEVYATRGNLNNHIGVPLTLLAMGRDVEISVVEMGASACGEIAALCAIAEPNFGLITNIGRSHLEGFGGPEGIRRGKGELFDFLAAHGGRAFVLQEDATLQAMAAERPALAVEPYSVHLADGVKNPLEGEYNRLNMAAALAVGSYFGVDRERMDHAIASYIPSNHRSQRVESERNTLMVDCYNANPSSMALAVDHFGREDLGGRIRKVLILGDMRELGAWSREEHRKILEQIARMGSIDVYLVGGEFAAAYQALSADERPGGVRCYPTAEALCEALRRDPVEQARVLIKGSHSVGLEQVIPIL